MGSKNDKNIYKILNNDLLLRVIACIQRIKDRRLLNLTENSYVGLVLHVTIAVNRIFKEGNTGREPGHGGIAQGNG